MSKDILIYGKLRNNTTSNTLAETDQIKDTELNKFQSEINKEQQTVNNNKADISYVDSKITGLDTARFSEYISGLASSPGNTGIVGNDYTIVYSETNNTFLAKDSKTNKLYSSWPTVDKYIGSDGKILDKYYTLGDTEIYVKSESGGLVKVAKNFTDRTDEKLIQDGGQYPNTTTTFYHGEVFNDTSSNMAIGENSHAEGKYTVAIGVNSHAEGESTRASGIGSHAEGGNTKYFDPCGSEGEYSHSEGISTYSKGNGSHAEGNRSWALGNNSHAEGFISMSKGENSHAEGDNNTTYGENSHAEGKYNTTFNRSSHTEGANNYSGGWVCIAEAGCTIGLVTYKKGDYFDPFRHKSSDLETKILPILKDTTKFSPTGDYSHSEGWSTQALGLGSHAEGGCDDGSGGTTAYGMLSHAEGDSTVAYGYGSHSEGISTEAIGVGSHAGGEGTIANNYAQQAIGSYNTKDTNPSAESFNPDKTIFGIGNGTSNSNRSDALKMLGNGTTWIKGVGDFDGTNPSPTNSLQGVLDSKQDNLIPGNGMELSYDGVTISHLGSIIDFDGFEQVTETLENRSSSDPNAKIIFDTKSNQFVFKEIPTQQSSDLSGISMPKYTLGHNVFFNQIYSSLNEFRKDILLRYNNVLYTPNKSRKGIIRIDSILESDLDSFCRLTDNGVYTVISPINSNRSSSGQVSIFSDSMSHVVYQVYYTSSNVENGILTSGHTDGVLHKWKRVYNINAPGLPAETKGTWSPWKPDDLTEAFIESEKIAASAISELGGEFSDFTSATSAAINDLSKRLIELESKHQVGTSLEMPINGKIGDTYFSTTTNDIYVHDGTKWICATDKTKAASEGGEVV